MSYNGLKNALLASCVVGLFPAGNAIAQDVAGEQGSVGVEDIVVTAQRRAESAQDVPLSVSVVSASTAEAMGVTDTSTLEAAVPGLQFTRSLNRATPALRGIGSNPNAPNGSESAIATYVDGVYIAAPAATIFSFNNIRQIEVLKGPQGTLFGRNATGGVVHVITRDPSFTPTADIDIGYASFDTVTGNLYGSAGIAPNVAADIAIHYQDQSEGWGVNLATGGDAYLSSEEAIRTKWLFTPGDSTRITFAADYNETETNSGISATTYPGAILPDGLTGYAGFYNVTENPIGFTGNTQAGASLTVEQNLGWANFVSISSYREVESETIYDADHTPSPITFITLDSQNETATQEFQLLSPSGSNLEWIAGVYFFHDTTQYNPIHLGTTFIRNKQITDSYSAYGQATGNLTEDTRLTIGLRYTTDEREQDGQITLGSGPLPRRTGESTFSKTTYRLALDHRFAPGFLGYASYNRGFKSGLFNLISVGAPPVRPEVIDAYEVGFKSDWFDERLQLNVAAYYYDFQNLQVSLLQGTTTTMVNAAASESQGIDIELQATPFENFRLSGAVSYIDGTFTDYPDAQITTPNPPTVPGDPSTRPLCSSGAATTNCVTTGDATGNRAPRAPEWSMNLSGQYTIPTSSGDFLLALSYYYNDGYYWEPDNRLEQPSYSLVSASIGWESNTSGLSLRLWGRNLLDEEYYLYSSGSVSGDTGSPAAPLNFGATIGYHW